MLMSVKIFARVTFQSVYLHLRLSKYVYVFRLSSITVESILQMGRPGVAVSSSESSSSSSESSSSNAPPSKRIKVGDSNAEANNASSIPVASDVSLDLDVAVVCYLAEDNTHHNISAILREVIKEAPDAPHLARDVAQRSGMCFSGEDVKVTLSSSEFKQRLKKNFPKKIFG